MIEWLRADRQDPAIELLGRTVPIHITRHARARRLTMRLSPDGGAVRVTLPRWSRSAEALRFARDRRDWLEAQLAGLAVAPAAVQATLVELTATTIAGMT